MMDFFRLQFCKGENRVYRVETKQWNMWMKVFSVYDGDTISVLCIHKGKIVRWRCRLIGYDSPELKTKDEDEKKRAIAARDFLKTILPKNAFRGKCKGLDKYGRILLDLKFKRKSISEIMIDSGHGLYYDGKTKSK